MVKKIIKELAIIILLLVAIGLIFCIVFYEYNTVNVTVPKKAEAYELPADTKTELDETLKANETQELIKTYIVDASDLKGYESSNDYEKGKVNPFAKYDDSTNNDTSGSSNNNGNSNNSTSNKGDSGNFLNTDGRK